MTDETNDPPEQGGIDRVELSDTDNPESLDFYDPEEDAVGGPGQEGTDDEADEASAEDEAEGQEAEDQPEAEGLADDAVVKMDDGTELTLGDLKQSPMLKADYTRKTQLVAQERRAAQADAQRIEAVTRSLVDNLSNMIPDEPGPELARTNPNAYTAQLAQYQHSMRFLQEIVNASEASKEVNKGISEREKREKVNAEFRALAEAAPEVRTDQGREKFFADVADVATQLGFDRSELGSITDHRLFVMAHWAKKGMEADRKGKIAKGKAQKAPPVAPRKPSTGRQVSDNRAAMRKLAKTGSFEDALSVDFD